MTELVIDMMQKYIVRDVGMIQKLILLTLSIVSLINILVIFLPRVNLKSAPCIIFLQIMFVHKLLEVLNIEK